MTKHDIIKELVHIERLLLRAKEFSHTQEGDEYITNAITKIVEVGQKMYPDIVRLRSKYVDPTM